MIPKNQVTKPGTTLDAAERAIDEAIRQGQADKGVNLLDTLPPVIDAVRMRYEGGGWNVRIENLRTPNGCRVFLK